MTYHYRPGPGSVVQASSSALWGLCILCAHPQAAPGPAAPPPAPPCFRGDLRFVRGSQGARGGLITPPHRYHCLAPPPPVGLEHLGGGVPTFSQNSSGKWGPRPPPPALDGIWGAFQPSCPASSPSGLWKELVYPLWVAGNSPSLFAACNRISLL